MAKAWARFKALLQAQLKQGLKPEQAGLALALGFYCGNMPILGISTALCAFLAFSLGLNMALIQAANYLAYPSQLLLWIPFLKAGTQVFGGIPIGLSPNELLNRAQTAPWALICDLGWAEAKAMALWALLGLLVVPLLWTLLSKACRRALALR